MTKKSRKSDSDSGRKIRKSSGRSQEEDWRNREKWEQYEEAVNEMLIRTSTEYAPWIVVEGNDKYYARLKVLETVIDALEKRISKKIKEKRCDRRI